MGVALRTGAHPYSDATTADLHPTRISPKSYGGGGPLLLSKLTRHPAWYMESMYAASTIHTNKSSVTLRLLGVFSYGLMAIVTKRNQAQRQSL